MDNIIELKKSELQELTGGEREWVLVAGCLCGGLVFTAFCVGYYIEYNS